MNKKNIYLSTACLGNSTISLTIINREEFSTDPTLDETLKNIYKNAFSRAYKDYWTPEFEEEFEQLYNSDLEKFNNNPDMFLIAISSDDTIAGWALFHVQDSRALLKIICVDPTFQKKKLGKELVFSIRTLCPDLKSIIVFTLLINANSPLFYESIGFVRTDLMLPEYAEFNMQGFECVLDA